MDINVRSLRVEERHVKGFTLQNMATLGTER